MATNPHTNKQQVADMTLPVKTDEVKPAAAEVKVVQAETKSVQTRLTMYMRGYASYYGGTDGFDGKPMANGDVFNSNNLHVAAHPTLPLGTKLKVTDLANNKVLYVEVTDRMPVHRGRVIDLSRGGAKYLGMHDKGIQQVELTKITDDEYSASIGKTA